MSDLEHPHRLRMGRRSFLQAAAATGAAVAVGHAIDWSLVAAQSASQAAARGTAPPVAYDSLPDAIPALAAALDYDATRIYRYVTDHIRYEPYAGSLRGAVGTLHARSGNAADQALLLGALLDRAIVPHRLVMGAIDDAAVAAIMGSTAADASHAHATTTEVLGVGGGDASGSTQMTYPGDADGQAYVDAAAADAAAIVPSATRQLQDSVADITGALTTAGISLPAATAQMPDLERTAHVWLQRAFGTGWLDLDPSLPGAQPGSTVAQPGEPFAILPDDMRHQVRFIVETEGVQAGQPVRQVVLDRIEYADELTGVPVTFSNIKPDGLSALGVGIGNVLGGTTQYNAVLSVGDQVSVGGVPIVLGTGDGGLFGDTTDQPNEGQTIGEWLEIQVMSPGRPTVSSRREVFDRVGAAGRAAGPVDVTAIPPVQLVDLDADTTAAYPPCLATHAFAITGGLVPGSYFATPPSATSIGAMSVVAHGYHMLRAGLADQVAVPAGVRTFCDGPNVASWTLAAADTAPDPSGDGLARLVSFDLWHRNLGVLPVEGVSATAPPQVIAGVLSHIAERIALRDLGGDTTEATALGVGVLFDVARQRGVPLRVFQGSLPAEAAYPAPAAARIRDALAAGLVVIAPERAIMVGGSPRLGWWKVDPLTGRTADELDDGRGTEMVEANMELSISQRAFYCLVGLGEKIVGVGLVVAKLFGASDRLQAGLGILAIAIWTFNFFNPGVGAGCRAGSVPVSLEVVP